MNPIVYLSRMLWRYGERKIIVLFAVLGVLANLIFLLEPLVLAWLISSIEQGEPLSKLLWICLCFVAVEFFGWCFHYPARIMENKHAFRAQRNYQQHLVDGVLHLPMSWHADHHSGDTIDKINNGAKALREYGSSVWLIIHMLVRLTAATLALLYFSALSAIAVIVILLLVFIIVIKFDIHIKKLLAEYLKLFNTVSAKVFDGISNITTVITLHLEKRIMGDVFTTFQQAYKPHKKKVVLDETKWFLVVMCTGVLSAAVTGIFVVMNYPLISIAALSAIYLYIQRLNWAFFEFAYHYSQFVGFQASIENAEVVASAFGPKRQRVKIPKWDVIKVKNLGFQYDKSSVLKNINLELVKGKNIAIIGKSGSGKSTLFKVLAGLHTHNSGSMMISGKSYSSLGEKVMLVPQEPEIFNTTIEKNITLGVAYKKADVVKAAKLAQVFSVIERLPHKWQSDIKEKGVNLSGGEKQRLALARALLAAKDKDIIMLDEATSSVDMATEQKIYSALFKEFKDKTLIASVHRLHLLDKFDEVLEFRKGKVVKR